MYFTDYRLSGSHVHLVASRRYLEGMGYIRHGRANGPRHAFPVLIPRDSEGQMDDIYAAVAIIHRDVHTGGNSRETPPEDIPTRVFRR